MLKQMTGALVAMTLALTPMSAAPAQAADAEDVAGIILGLGALYAIGRAIENNDRKDKKKDATRSGHRDWNDRYGRYDRYRDDRAWRHGNRMVLPRDCLRKVRTRDGRVWGYGARCLENTVARPGRLPDQCLRQVRTDRGTRWLYAPKCMERRGWRVADVQYRKFRD